MTKEWLRKKIEGLSGCDSSDEYAKGWDAACDAILELLDRGCENCTFEDACDWQAAGKEDSCDNWKREVQFPHVMLLKKYSNPTGTGWISTICPKCGAECWDRAGNRGPGLCVECILEESKWKARKNEP